MGTQLEELLLVVAGEIVSVWESDFSPVSVQSFGGHGELLLGQKRTLTQKAVIVPVTMRGLRPLTS